MGPDFMRRLQALRDKIGRIRIGRGCGYRCRAYNAKIGGAKESQHIFLRAADPDPLDVPLWVAVVAAFQIGFGGVGFGKGKLHVDDGPTRWWCYKSRKEHVA